MHVNWEGLWHAIFGVDEWMGLDMGFWAAMIVVALVVVVQNIVFWKCFSPYDKYRLRRKEREDE